MTAEVAEILEALPIEERLILPCLQRIQRNHGYITDDAVDSVAAFLNVSRAEVIGVLTYYHDLRRTPPPAVSVRVCVAEACQAQGVRALLADIDSASIEFTKVYCFGNCALGPAVMVGDRLIGRCDIAALTAAVVRAQGNWA
ncbi:MAG: NAD(P)H-dependent oxidoreductase subunit E [Mycobacterium sp.]